MHNSKDLFYGIGFSCSGSDSHNTQDTNVNFDKSTPFKHITLLFNIKNVPA